MKRITIFRLLLAFLIVVFLFGGATSAYPHSKDFHKTECVKAIKKDAAKLSPELFADVAIVITIPVNHIGFYSYVYKMEIAPASIYMPVAHAPPSQSTA